MKKVWQVIIKGIHSGIYEGITPIEALNRMLENGQFSGWNEYSSYLKLGFKIIGDKIIIDDI